MRSGGSRGWDRKGKGCSCLREGWRGGGLRGGEVVVPLCDSGEEGRGVDIRVGCDERI